MVTGDLICIDGPLSLFIIFMWWIVYIYVVDWIVLLMVSEIEMRRTVGGQDMTWRVLGLSLRVKNQKIKLKSFSVPHQKQPRNNK